MKIHFLRARFKKEIVAEFLPPKKPSRNVIILCDGAPGVPSKRSLIKFFSNKGYWVFHPRYRGSWESGGSFLKISPHHDILDIIDQLPKGFTELFNGTRHTINPSHIYLIGGSFGGPAIILASRDPRVTKGIAFAPVVDWSKLGPAEPIATMEKFFAAAFGNGYRFNSKDWKKLRSGTFYNPVTQTKTIDGSKLFIIQAKDDNSVRWQPVARFAKRTGAQLWLMKSGGHLSTSNAIKARFYKKIKTAIHHI